MRGSWDRERDPLVALTTGDPAPFEEFVRTEVGTFLGFFQRMGADPQEAEDLTQEVFLKLFRHAAQYDPRERFTAFCFRIARNAWIDRARRTATRGLAGTRGPSRSGSEGDDAVDLAALVETDEREAGTIIAGREESRRLHVALGALPDTHRSVFELGALQDLSYAEVSGLLDIPVGTVKSRMFHAVRRLRAALERPEALRYTAEVGEVGS